MIAMKLNEVASILNARCPAGDIGFEGISKDTRSIQPNNLFIAITGEQFDGNNFVDEAFKKGAAAALVSRPIDSKIPQLIVEDTIDALGKLTKNWRDRFNLPLIGVTGSNGKTTVKNMIAAILKTACKGDETKILATEGNLNNNIGLPFTLARLSEHHQFGVLEMGMNHEGEIAYLTKLASPQVALVNNAAEAHLQGLKDVAGVARAKGEIFLGLPKDGVAVINKDDAFYNYWRGLIKNQNYLTFSLENTADFTANICNTTPTHQLLVVNTPKGSVEINLPLLGKHNVMNTLAAAACTLAIGIDLNAIKSGLESMQPAPGRLNIYELPNGLRIIDDTYNANPFSTHAAIKTLSTFQGKKILVLGDMKELGPTEIELHAVTGKRAREAGIDFVFTYGTLSAATSEHFGENGHHFSDKEKLIYALQPHLENGNTILVKGSRSMKMEHIVAKIMPAKHTITSLT